MSSQIARERIQQKIESSITGTFNAGRSLAFDTLRLT